MPPKISNAPAVPAGLNDVEMQAFTSAQPRLENVVLHRNPDGHYALRASKGPEDVRNAAASTPAAVLDALNNTLVRTFTAPEERPAPRANGNVGEQQPVSNKQIRDVVSRVLDGYRNRSELSGRDVQEIIGKVDMRMKALAQFSADQIRAFARSSHDSSVYIRRNSATQQLELHRRSGLGTIWHGIARFVGRANAREQDALTYDVLKAAVFSREKTLGSGRLNRTQVNTALEHVDRAHTLDSTKIIRVFSALDEKRRTEMPAREAEQLLPPRLRAEAAFAQNKFVAPQSFSVHRAQVLDTVWGCRELHVPFTLRATVTSAAYADMSRAMGNQYDCLSAIAEAIIPEESLKPEDMLTEMPEAKGAMQLRTPVEFIVHCMEKNGFPLNAGTAARLVAGEILPSPAHRHETVHANVQAFADTRAEDYMHGSMWKTINTVLRAYIEDTADGAYRPLNLVGNDPMLSRSTLGPDAPANKAQYEGLVRLARSFQQAQTAQDRLLNYLLAHSDGPPPSVEAMRNALHELVNSRPDQDTLNERTLLQRFCTTLYRNVEANEKKGLEQIRAEQEAQAARARQTQLEAEAAQKARAELDARNLAVARGLMAHYASVGVQDGHAAAEPFQVAEGQQMAYAEARLHHTVDGRLDPGSPRRVPDSQVFAGQTGDAFTSLSGSLRQANVRLNSDEDPRLEQKYEAVFDNLVQAYAQEPGMDWDAAASRAHEQLSTLAFALRGVKPDTSRFSGEDVMQQALSVLVDHPETLRDLTMTRITRIGECARMVHESPLNNEAIEEVLEQTITQKDLSVEHTRAAIQKMVSDFKRLSYDNLHTALELQDMLVRERYDHILSPDESRTVVRMAQAVMQAAISEPQHEAQRLSVEEQQALRNAQAAFFESMDKILQHMPVMHVTGSVAEELAGSINSFVTEATGKESTDAVFSVDAIRDLFRAGYLHQVADRMEGGSLERAIITLEDPRHATQAQAMNGLIAPLAEQRTYLHTAAEHERLEQAYDTMIRKALETSTLPDDNLIHSLNTIFMDSMKNRVTDGEFDSDLKSVGLPTSLEQQGALVRAMKDLEPRAEVLHYTSIRTHLRNVMGQIAAMNTAAVQHVQAERPDVYTPLMHYFREYETVAGLVAAQQLEPQARAIVDGFMHLSTVAATPKGFLRSNPACTLLFRENLSTSVAVRKAAMELVREAVKGIPAHLVPRELLPQAVSTMLRMLVHQFRAEGQMQQNKHWDTFTHTCDNALSSAVVTNQIAAMNTEAGTDPDRQVIARCTADLLQYMLSIRDSGHATI